MKVDIHLENQCVKHEVSCLFSSNYEKFIYLYKMISYILDTCKNQRTRTVPKRTKPYHSFDTPYYGSVRFNFALVCFNTVRYGTSMLFLQASTVLS